MMRILILGLWLLNSGWTFSQTNNAVFDAIRKADMNLLNQLFDDKIEYCFDNQIEFVDKSVALKAFKAFLERNVPKSLTPMHKGSSKAEDSNFAIAILETTNGRKFRIYVYSENLTGKTLVQELRIDKVNP